MLIPPESTRTEWTLDQLRKKIENKTLKVEIADELFATVNKERLLNSLIGKEKKYTIFHKLSKYRVVYVQIKHYYGRDNKG